MADGGSVMDGLVSRKVFRTDVGVSDRTVLRWQDQGLPHLKLGTGTYYPTERARQWLLDNLTIKPKTERDVA